MSEDCKHILDQGIEAWNIWRRINPEIKPKLSEIDLSDREFLGANFRAVNFFRTTLKSSFLVDANLSEAELERAELVNSDLSGANLDGVTLYQANCSDANFRGASFDSANLKEVDLSFAKLCNANLINADLFKANLSNADLSGANLTGARLIKANVQSSNLEGCRVYGASAWNIIGTPANQQNLIITPEGEPEIRVDDLEVAQFVYLLLNNEKIRNVIDTVAKKGVLILGRFTEERLNVLRAIRNKLRDLGYLPILFDFTKPESHSFIETVSTIAHLSRFIIADFTQPKAVLEEVPLIMQDLSIPLQPLIMKGSGKLPSTFHNLKVSHRDKILEPYPYIDENDLLVSFQEKIIAPAEIKASAIVEEKRLLLEKHNSTLY